MRLPFIASTFSILISALLQAEESTHIDLSTKHNEGSNKVADDQDELSADVQQLIIEQTIPKVIELFNQAESIMDEATDRLEEGDTGGETIAAQTEVIEKIYNAAKEKEQNGKAGQSKPGGAMMDMMKRMMENEKQDEKKDEKNEGTKLGDKGGDGQTGLSDTSNEAIDGNTNNKSEARRVPKASGNSRLEIPEEFRKAFDAYNRSAEKKVK